jgi:thiol-disulfide isomerase/thioredoxin
MMGKTPRKEIAMKKTLTQRLLCLALSALLLGAPSLVLAQEESNESEINIFEYFEGSDLDLSPYKGKALFLNFFTEWCGYCMEEMDSIKQIFETYSQEELQIILVHCWSGEDATTTERVKERFGMEEMTFFEDETMSVAELIGLQGYPTSIFVDKEGMVDSVTYALSYEQMAEIVEGLGVGGAEADRAPAPAGTAPPPTAAPVPASKGAKLS